MKIKIKPLYIADIDKADGKLSPSEVIGIMKAHQAEHGCDLIVDAGHVGDFGVFGARPLKETCLGIRFNPADSGKGGQSLWRNP